MKEREANRILEYLGLRPPQPSESTVVRASSSKEKAVKTKKKRPKR